MKRFLLSGRDFFLDSEGSYILRAVAVVLVLNSHTDLFGNPIGIGGQIGNGIFFLLAGKFSKRTSKGIKKLITYYLVLNAFSIIPSLLLTANREVQFVDLWFVDALLIYLLVDLVSRVFLSSNFLIYYLVVYVVSSVVINFQNLEQIFLHKIIFYSIFFYFGKNYSVKMRLNFAYLLALLVYVFSGLRYFGFYSQAIQQIMVFPVVVLLIGAISFVKPCLKGRKIQNYVEIIASCSLPIYFWQVYFLGKVHVIYEGITAFLLLTLFFSFLSNRVLRKIKF